MKFLYQLSIASFIIWLASCKPAQAIDAETFTTPNKIEIILLEDTTTNLVSINLAFKGAGSRADPVGKEGLGSLMMKLIFRSSAMGMDRHQKARKVRDLGILHDIQYAIDNDDILVSYKCPIETFEQSLELLHTILFKAELTVKELNKLKGYGSANAQLSTANEISFAWNTLRANIYQGHPYAYPSYGILSSIQKITLPDIEMAIQQRLAKSNLIVSVVGRINKNKLSKYLEKAFSSLASQAQLSSIQTIEPSLDGSISTIVKDSPQSSAIFAQASLPSTHPDFYALLILNRILGSEPFTSRLWSEVREKRGLVYDIGTSTTTDTELAHLLYGWFKSNNEDVYQIIDIIKEQWQEIRNKGVSKTEFDNAVTGLVGEFALQFITPEQISNYLIHNHLAGHTIAHINNRNDKVKAVTLEQVNQVAKSVLMPEQLTFVVVGNPPPARHSKE